MSYEITIKENDFQVLHELINMGCAVFERLNFYDGEGNIIDKNPILSERCEESIKEFNDILKYRTFTTKILVYMVPTVSRVRVAGLLTYFEDCKTNQRTLTVRNRVTNDTNLFLPVALLPENEDRTFASMFDINGLCIPVWVMKDERFEEIYSKSYAAVDQ